MSDHSHDHHADNHGHDDHGSGYNYFDESTNILAPVCIIIMFVITFWALFM